MSDVEFLRRRRNETKDNEKRNINLLYATNDAVQTAISIDMYFHQQRS